MYLPESVKYIIEVLEKNGYEAYAVGGCVRDSILGRSPDDWDITTSAKPEQTRELFEKTFDTGIEHGTITVLLDNIGYEVTTYRIDGEYEDSRRPNDVEFTTDLREDLLRRDFTINAMAYNKKDGLVDIFGGVKDLESKTIRCVGAPKDRFEEDALRILRAIRFSAQLGFEIDDETAIAIKEMAPSLSKISAERIQVEMMKLILSKHPSYIDKAYNLGVTAVIFPEWDVMMSTIYGPSDARYNLGEHTLSCLEYISNKKVSRLLALLHSVGKPKRQGEVESLDTEGAAVAKSIMKRWKMDNHTIRDVSKLVEVHELIVEPTLPEVRRAINQMGEDLFPVFHEMQFVDVMSRNSNKRVEKLSELKGIGEIYQTILTEKHPVTLKDLAIDGGALLEMGVPQGKQIGSVLKQLLELVLEDHTRNTKEWLQEEVKKYM